MGNYYGREQKKSKQQEQDEEDFYSASVTKNKTKEIIVEGADYHQQQHPEGPNFVLSRTFQVRVTVDR